VRKILKNRALVMTILGMAIMAQSVLWEYVRVEPTYRFIVEPWSLRGYELTQGLVIAAAAIGIAIFTLLVVRGVIKETLLSSGLAVGAGVAFAVVITIMSNPNDVKMPFPIHVGLSVIGAVVVVALLEGFIPKEWDRRRRLTRIGMWLAAAIVLLFGVVGPILKSEQPFWIFVAVAGIVVGALALFRPPAELAGFRWIINSIVAVWMMSLAMSASLRQALQVEQLAQGNGDISGKLLDLQITSGVLLAWLGGLIGFIGAVGLWANRRDQIIAHDRARQQQEAARESEEQLTA